MLQSLGAVSAKLKPGAALKLKVSLSEGGSLFIELQRVRAGRKQGTTCKAGGRKGKRCSAITKVSTVNIAGMGGSAIVALPKRKLAAGDYRAVVTPVDAAGNRGAARTVSFKVTRNDSQPRARRLGQPGPALRVDELRARLEVRPTRARGSAARSIAC